MDDKTIVQLRTLIQEALDNHLHNQAIFFANKLVSLSKKNPEDIYQLAQAYYAAKQYRRASHLLEKENLHRSNVKYMYLYVRCKAECNEWGDCLEILGEDNRLDTPDVKMKSALFYLRGRAFEALENRQKAALWYQKAIVADVHCFEALDRLTSNSMLTAKEEMELMKSLTFQKEDEWLKELYAMKFMKYKPQADLEQVQKLVQQKLQLATDEDVLTSQAENYFYHNQFDKAYAITKKILNEDPHNFSNALVIHISCMVELNLKNELFYCAHKLVDNHPELYIAWYAVGCYYYLIGNYENARRYFSKSTSMNRDFGAGWLGFGHSFAQEGEHDQAMAAYRSAARILHGSHLPSLCIGMELVRANNYALAQEFLLKAKEICPFDPLVYNELGVIYFRNKYINDATAHFEKALKLVTNDMRNKDTLQDSWEPTVFNLGHCYRKLKQYDKAMACYQWAQSLTQAGAHRASIYTAIAFTHHLQGNVMEAMDIYHEALGLNSEDTFAHEMLQLALEDSLAEDFASSVRFDERELRGLDQTEEFDGEEPSGDNMNDVEGVDDDQ